MLFELVTMNLVDAYLKIIPVSFWNVCSRAYKIETNVHHHTHAEYGTYCNLSVWLQFAVKWLNLCTWNEMTLCTSLHSLIINGISNRDLAGWVSGVRFGVPGASRRYLIFDRIIIDIIRRWKWGGGQFHSITAIDCNKRFGGALLLFTITAGDSCSVWASEVIIERWRWGYLQTRRVVHHWKILTTTDVLLIRCWTEQTEDQNKVM